MKFTTTINSNLLEKAAIGLVKVSDLFNSFVLVPKGASHSVPNKILSVALTGVAAYYCNFPVWIVALQCFSAFLSATFGARRWFVEVATVSPLIVVGLITLEPTNILTFSILLTYKYFLEVYCHCADRIIRALATLTTDKAHSYYYFWVLGMGTLLSATHASDYVQGFFAGFVQGFTGN